MQPGQHILSGGYGFRNQLDHRAIGHFQKLLVTYMDVDIWTDAEEVSDIMSICIVCMICVVQGLILLK